jgi:hypothetical protein
MIELLIWWALGIIQGIIIRELWIQSGNELGDMKE